MPPITHSAPDAGPAFELKGRMATLSVLRVLSADLAVLAAQLEESVAKAPEFFRGLSVVLDLEALADGELPDLAALSELLRAQGLQLLGGRAGTEPHNAALRQAGLAVIGGMAQESPRRIAKPVREAPAAVGLVVTQPIRSGQQVYARASDLVVLSSVSPGAEILADGHVHVYGTLRGRVLAGVQGNREARIFCQGLEAELVSIAGNYQVAEQFRGCVGRGPVQVYLDGETLRIEPL